VYSLLGNSSFRHIFYWRNLKKKKKCVGNAYLEIREIKRNQKKTEEKSIHAGISLGCLTLGLTLKVRHVV
jgi:hypothetical protein